jgi:pyruvate,water dikinase
LHKEKKFFAHHITSYLFSMRKDTAFILDFKDISLKDVPLVGGKNASLGEMFRELTPKEILIPDGFALTAHAYRYFLTKNGLNAKIQDLLRNLDTQNIEQLSERGYAIRQAVMETPFPHDLISEIKDAYRKLSKKYNSRAVDTAVRSSATSEDLPDASFAGQQESYLNVRGEYALLESCKKCIASLFTNRAISYRFDKGFDHMKIALSVGIQKMVRSDKASSGVMFTLDPVSGFEDIILINSSWGLGENIVKGRITPDEFVIFKKTLSTQFNPILSKELGSKKLRMIYSLEGNQTTTNTPVTKSDQNKFSLLPDEAILLAKWGLEIEKHYKMPMDIEWAKDGITKKLFIVQARPETVHTQARKTIYEEYIVEHKTKPVLSGQAIGFKVGQGKVQVVKNVQSISKFLTGNVLVTEMTDPDWEPIMKKAAAIVTNSGGKTCHAAIVSRELGIPCIVGTKVGTEVLLKHNEVTVSCAEGEVGNVYEGKVPFTIKKINLTKLPKVKTKIMMNLGNPEAAFEFSHIPNDGVGLAREEFIISNHIKIHPNALLHPEKIKDTEIKTKIKDMIKGYPNGEEFFIDKLTQGIAKIGAAFFPKDVIVRLSDFKTSEYANLLGGKDFEPKESNPMIGFRGASRYYSEAFKEAFNIECKALHNVRERMGLFNVHIMVPFCRTPEEGEKVLRLLAKNGLVRRKHHLKILVMCEIPSNVILADDFSGIFDGFSIGSNDLTQLTLGLDRDSALVSFLYDERNEAVKKLIAEVIKKAHAKGRTVGICGEAPSNYPDFTKFLIEQHIDSVSLEPDSMIKTRLMISKLK